MALSAQRGWLTKPWHTKGFASRCEAIFWMRRVACLTLILLTLFSAAIIAALAIGSTRPLLSAALWQQMFSNPNGLQCQMPCMFGIELNRMTTREGAEILWKHPFVSDFLGFKKSDIVSNSPTYFQISSNNNNDSQFIAFGGNGQSEKITSLGFLSTFHSDFTLGQALLNWGAPSYLLFLEADSPHAMVLEYPAKGLGVMLLYAPGDSLRPDSQLAGFYLAIDETAASRCKGYFCQTWQGLKRIAQYKAEGPMPLNFTSSPP